MNRPRFLLLAFLLTLLVNQGFTQSQAPITWGQPRLMRVFPGDTLPHFMKAKGDTVVYCAEFISGQNHVNRVYITTNLGQSWQPAFNTYDSAYVINGQWASYSPSIAMTETAIYVQNPVGRGFEALWKTTNAGLQWTHVITPWSRRLRIDDNVGDTLLFKDDSALLNRHISMTYNNGQSIQRLYPEPTYMFLQVLSSYIHYTGVSSRNGGLYYGRINCATGDSLPLVELSPELGHSSVTTVQSAFTGSFSCMVFDPSGGSPFPVYLHTSQDDGLHWTPAIEMTSGFTGYSQQAVGAVDSRGFICWGDTTNDPTQFPGYTSGGLRFRFTANAGNSFYPSRSFCPNTSTQYRYSVFFVDYSNNRVRVHSVVMPWGSSAFHMYCIEGIVTPDTLTPQITQYRAVPNYCTVDSMVSLSFRGFDNDSLWRARFALVSVVNPGDTVYVPLPFTSDSTYASDWRVPDMPGEYSAFYMAEDMWGNVQRTPTPPFTITIQPNNASPEPTDPLVSNYPIRAYPNPFNSSVTITLQFSNHELFQSLLVYDRQGRVVWSPALSTGMSVSYPRSLVWLGVDGSGLPVSTGVYFLHVQTNINQYTKKLLLMR